MEENDAFGILNYIGEDVTLVQLVDSRGNVNHDISIVGHLIFDYKYKKALCLTQESLDIICYPSIGEELIATFQSVFYAIRYSWSPNYLLKDKHDTAH